MSDAAKPADETAATRELDGLVGYHLRRASAVFSADFSQVMADTSIRQTLFGILSMVGCEPGISQSAVGRALGVQRANMVALMAELTEAGLLTRDLTLGDRRGRALALSAKGKALLSECRTRIAAHEARLLAGFSEAERTSLLALLRRI